MKNGKSEKSIKVAVLTHGTVGDILPITALVQAFSQKLHNDKNILKVFMISSIMAMKREIKALVEAAKITLVPIGLGSSDSENDKEKQRAKEMVKCYEACQDIQPDYLLFTLFACEGWFISQKLKIPCMAISPFLQTRYPPQNFQKCFQKENPELFSKLQSSIEGYVSYAEIEAWMWRLYLNDFEGFTRKLGICCCPYEDKIQAENLPPPTPLLYGVSNAVVNRPSWPPSVRVCGHWSTEKLYTTAGLSYSYFADDWDVIETFVRKWKGRLVYLGFGSMEDINSIDGPLLKRIINMIIRELETHNLALILCTSNSDILNMIQSSHLSNSEVGSICGTSSFLPHHTIFPHCNLIMHHGGSGTVHSAIKASVPQIIMPLMFDQVYWGDQIQWLGLGYNLGHLRNMTSDGLRHAFTFCLSNVTADVVHNYAKKMNEEDGLEVASNLICQAFNL